MRTLNQEKREGFLRAALKLFVLNGVTHTSTAEIARKTGTASGTLFLYFPSKQDLLDEIILNIGRQQSESVKARISDALSAQEIFSCIWERTITWFLENMDSYQFLQQVRDTGLISIDAVEKSAQFFDYYYHAIQKGLQEESIKDYSPALIGEFLYQDIVAVMNTLKLEHDPKQFNLIIQQGFDIFWDGIRNTPKNS